MNYLVFRLYGPMASWGQIAVGEARHSNYYPSKSAITGLLGAALGLRREDDEKHLNLARCYQQGVKVLSAGRLLKDYHTAQAPDSVGKFTYRTRRDEIRLGRDRLGTVLSTREYYTDAQAVVALTALDNARWNLSELQQALLKPRFHLYLGRKSCPLAAPLNPKLIEAEGFLQALDVYYAEPLVDHPSDRELPDWLTDKRWLPHDANAQYYWEGVFDDFSVETTEFTVSEVQQIVQHDQPLSRRRWQFQPRKVYRWQRTPNQAKESQHVSI